MSLTYEKKQTGLKMVKKKDKVKKLYPKRVKSWDDMVNDDYVVVDATTKNLEK